MEILTIGKFMTETVTTVRPEQSIYDAMKLLIQKKISGVPVVDKIHGRERMVGILSEKDFFAILSNSTFYNEWPIGTVAEYMTRKIVTLTPEKSIFEAASAFDQHSYRRIPVVENGDMLVGIVTRGDILRASQRYWESHYANHTYKSSMGERATATISRFAQKN